MADEPLLSAEEMECLDHLAKAAGLGFRIIGRDGSCTEQDAGEWAHDIHVLQDRIMSQAAARAYPERFRPLGGRIPNRQSK